MDSKVRYLPEETNISQAQAQRSQAPPAPPVAVAQKMDQQTALNTMVSFLNISLKRGVFTFEEAANIWECLKVFGAK